MNTNTIVFFCMIKTRRPTPYIKHLVSMASWLFRVQRCKGLGFKDHSKSPKGQIEGSKEPDHFRRWPTGKGKSLQVTLTISLSVAENTRSYMKNWSVN